MATQIPVPQSQKIADEDGNLQRQWYLLFVAMAKKIADLEDRIAKLEAK